MNWKPLFEFEGALEVVCMSGVAVEVVDIVCTRELRGSGGGVGRDDGAARGSAGFLGRHSLRVPRANMWGLGE